MLLHLSYNFPFTNIDDKEQLIDRLATLTTGGNKNPTAHTDPHRTGLYVRRKKPLYTGKEVYWRHPQSGQIRQLNPNFKYGYVKRPYGYRYVSFISHAQLSLPPCTLIRPLINTTQNIAVIF